MAVVPWPTGHVGATRGSHGHCHPHHSWLLACADHRTRSSSACSWGRKYTRPRWAQGYIAEAPKRTGERDSSCCRWGNKTTGFYLYTPECALTFCSATFSQKTPAWPYCSKSFCHATAPTRAGSQPGSPRPDLYCFQESSHHSKPPRPRGLLGAEGQASPTLPAGVRSAPWSRPPHVAGTPFSWRIILTEESTVFPWPCFLFNYIFFLSICGICLHNGQIKFCIIYVLKIFSNLSFFF